MTECKITNVNPYQTVAATTSTDAVTNNNVPLCNNTDTNSDVVNVNNDSTENQQTTLRTNDELYNNIKALCTQFGVDFEQAKNQNLIEKISGLSNEELLNCQEEELKKAIKKVTNAFDLTKARGQELSIENIINSAGSIKAAETTYGEEKIAQELANIKSGKNSNILLGKSIAERLSIFYNLDYNSLSNEKKREYINRFFAGFFDEKGLSDDVQRNTFTNMYANSSPEDKILMLDAIKSLRTTNRGVATKTWLNNFITDEDKSNAIKKAVVDENINIAEIVTGNNTHYEEIEGHPEFDANTGVLDQETATEITKIIAEHVDEETAQKIANDLKEIDEKIRKINEAIRAKANGEELTEEQQKLLEEIKGSNADYQKIQQAIIGANVGVISGLWENDNDNSDIIAAIWQNSEDMDLAIGSNVHTMIGNALDNHIDKEIQIGPSGASKDKGYGGLRGLIDSVEKNTYEYKDSKYTTTSTSGSKKTTTAGSYCSNYTTNNNSTVNNSNTSVTTVQNFGLTNANKETTKNISKTTSKTQSREVQKDVNEDCYSVTTPSYITLSENIEITSTSDFNEYAKAYSDQKQAVAEFYKENGFNDTVEVVTKKHIQKGFEVLYKQYNQKSDKEQASFISKLNNFGIVHFLKETKESALKYLDKMPSFYAQTLVNHKLEEVEKTV